MELKELEQWCRRENDDGKGNFKLVPKTPVLIIWDTDMFDDPYPVKSITFFDADKVADINGTGGPGVGIDHNSCSDYSYRFDASVFPTLKFNIYIKAN